MLTFWFLVLTWFYFTQVHCKLYSLNNYERRRLLNESYDPTVPPIQDRLPVEVGMKVYVLNIRSIKESDLTLTVDLFVHQIWKDWRLNIPILNSDDMILLSSSYKDKLWIPDVYFKNSIAGKLKGVFAPSLYFILDSNKRVLMAARISLQLTCDMTFKNYPHDIQKCAIDMMSLSHTNDSVVLKWYTFKMTANLSLTQYKVEDVDIDDCSRTYEIGTFSCVRGIFALQRLVGHFMLKFYIPSTLVVVMTFVGYYIPVSAHPARVALVITALLSLITLQLHITSNIHTAYVVSINIWMLICIGFVFVGFIEYAFAIAWIDKQNGGSQSKWFSKLSSWVNSNNHHNHHHHNHHSKTDSQFNLNPIDLMSRKLFPILFLTAILVYIIFVYFSQYK